MIFRNAISASDFDITDGELKFKKKTYSLQRVKKVDLRCLSVKDNMVNVVSLALILSAATWAFVPAFGLPTLVLTMLIGIISWKKYELRAEYSATDETGDYWVTIANCRSEHELGILKKMEQDLTQYLCLN
ncbi:hypothetical protein MACH09_30490 [Vibrio sp. MACH09]|uniref:hypothetical protein n=1 Tax=Vibrio sp. MACH09 TaxID=3025122 RepID=UPI00278E57E0|nr:hypothetical protein [Vibrio sp. MACH09]GLO62541.1 hypothetical protein MACH09_30490 [Vibrio sp. MACH09]